MNTVKTFIHVAGQKLYVEYSNCHANRPTIVFLHDSLGCVQLWRDFPEKLGLAARCNILVYDRLGYGKSAPMPGAYRPIDYLEAEAGVLYCLLGALGINNAILFGHSDGGSIALIAAAKYTGIIKGVICEAGHIFVEEVTLNGIHEAINAFNNTDLPQRLEKYHGDKTLTLFRAWTDTWTRSDFRGWNIEHLLHLITAPLLFIQGQNDEYGTLLQVHNTIKAVSGAASSIIIAQTGHTPHKETPQETLKAAADFLCVHWP